MGIIGAIFYGVRGTYHLIKGDGEKANKDLDKAVDSLHKPIYF